MTDSQFAYSHLTLDELRSMAASPQVGTMQAMPHSFRALADRVGEVADLLTHAQADLPNWWKGPAAVQAAATLGRAAAEARDFHESALGAATAVGHCAQIVAEQQNQMMSVPDVAEPGVTDVVPHPTTPFEALEAARQDATYQAAHQQAAQVVNGIAAQYVETRGQLKEIGAFRAENFAPSTTDPHFSESNSEPPRESSSRFGSNDHLGFDTSRFRSATTGPDTRDFISEKDRTLAEAGATHLAPAESKSRTFVFHEIPKDGADGYPALSHSQKENVSPTRLGDSDYATSNAPSKATLTDEAAPSAGLDSEHNSANRRLARTGVDLPSKSATPPSTRDGHNRPTVKAVKGNDHLTFGDRQLIDTFAPNQGMAAAGEGPLFASLQPGLPGSENGAMIPPYSGIGPMHSTREERSRRPAYLKEQKSSWLPDTVAAPADGVITPDWLEDY